jgi:hypothetical protein
MRYVIAGVSSPALDEAWGILVEWKNRRLAGEASPHDAPSEVEYAFAKANREIARLKAVA